MDNERLLDLLRRLTDAYGDMWGVGGFNLDLYREARAALADAPAPTPAAPIRSGGTAARAARSARGRSSPCRAGSAAPTPTT